MHMSKPVRLACLIAVLLPLAAMLLLSRWNYSQGDDYIGNWLRQGHGFWGMQKWIYLNWGGRYTSSFLAALSSGNDLLFRAPRLFPVLLMTAEVVAFCFFFRTILRTSLPNTLFLAASAFLVNANLLPEPSSAFYWVPGAATYQVPFVLSILLAAFLYRLVRKRTLLNLWASVLLVILITGSNEMSALIIIPSVLVTIFFLYRNKRLDGMDALWIAIAGLVSLVILFVSPGITIRQSILPDPEWLITWPATAAWALFSIWELFTQPCFWAIAALMYYLGNTGIIQQRIPRRLLWQLTAIQLIALAAVLYSTHGSIPLRMLNVYTTFNALLIFVASASFGADTRPILRQDVMLRSWIMPILTVVILFSGITGSIVQSFLAAPFAQQVNRQWISSIAEASEKGIRYIVLPSYKESIDSLVKGSNLKVVMKILAGQPPALLKYPYGKGDKGTILHLIVRHNMDSVRLGRETIGWPEWAKRPGQ
jgi:hypothetical protein